MTNITYTGNGTAFIPGVPTRDLTPDEWAQLTPEQQHECTVSGLYKPAETKKAVKEAVNA